LFGKAKGVDQSNPFGFGQAATALGEDEERPVSTEHGSDLR
jgi:hypothetical protein